MRRCLNSVTILGPLDEGERGIVYRLSVVIVPALLLATICRRVTSSVSSFAVLRSDVMLGLVLGKRPTSNADTHAGATCRNLVRERTAENKTSN